ncbi:MAG: alpha/beta hydrolase family protein [Tepidisphaeraceae bacterium]
MRSSATLVWLLLPLAARAAEVQSRDINWTDPARHRSVPVRVYFPIQSAGPVPIVLFSNWLGGSREGYRYLGEYWASHGYIAVHIQHVGSDDSVWKNHPPAERLASLKRAANFREYVERTQDVHFVIDQLTLLNRQAADPLAGRLDLAHIAMAGHSFGGQTTEAISGEVFTLPGSEVSYADPRVTCAIVMSPAPPAGLKQRESAFRKVTMPVLYVTGTQDESPIGNTHPQDRRVPYDLSPAGDKFLITFKGGDHMMFSGARLRTPAQQRMDEADRPILLEATTRFLDAYLKSDAQAKAWLQTDLKTRLGDLGTLESK